MLSKGGLSFNSLEGGGHGGSGNGRIVSFVEGKYLLRLSCCFQPRGLVLVASKPHVHVYMHANKKSDAL